MLLGGQIGQGISHGAQAVIGHFGLVGAFLNSFVLCALGAGEIDHPIDPIHHGFGRLVDPRHILIDNFPGGISSRGAQSHHPKHLSGGCRPDGSPQYFPEGFERAAGIHYCLPQATDGAGCRGAGNHRKRCGNGADGGNEFTGNIHDGFNRLSEPGDLAGRGGCFR